MKSVLFVYLSIVGGMLAASAVHAQPGKEAIQRVFADWNKRRQAIERIRYTVVGHSILPAGSRTDMVTGKPLDPPTPPKDIAQKQDSTFLLELPKKRFRLEMVGELYLQEKKQMFPRVTMTVFDGNSMATEMPREANTSAVSAPAPSDFDVFINRNYSRYHPLDAVNIYFLSPLLLSHGLLPRFLDPADFGRALDPADFVVHGRHQHAGRQCLVLRTLTERTSRRQASYDEYWVDTERDSAVLRQSAYVNDKLMVDVDVTYQQTPRGWLPLRWTGTTRKEDRLINVTRLSVQEFTIDPPVSDADFQPEVKPGMNVLETTYEDPEKVQGQARPAYSRKTFHVGQDGSWNEVINGVEQKSHRWLWYSLGIVLAMVVGVFWLARRYGRRIPANPGPTG